MPLSPPGVGCSGSHTIRCRWTSRSLRSSPRAPKPSLFPTLRPAAPFGRITSRAPRHEDRQRNDPRQSMQEGRMLSLRIALSTRAGTPW
eukprot:scaffold325593_cov57-Tisochrysis_lutea.AAC.2